MLLVRLSFENKGDPTKTHVFGKVESVEVEAVVVGRTKRKCCCVYHLLYCYYYYLLQSRPGVTVVVSPTEDANSCGSGRVPL